VALDGELGCLAPQLAPDSRPLKLIGLAGVMLEAMTEVELGGSYLWKLWPTAPYRRLAAAHAAFVELVLAVMLFVLHVVILFVLPVFMLFVLAVVMLFVLAVVMLFVLVVVMLFGLAVFMLYVMAVFLLFVLAVVLLFVLAVIFIGCCYLSWLFCYLILSCIHVGN
jgi:hypothetical protein